MKKEMRIKRVECLLLIISCILLGLSLSGFILKAYPVLILFILVKYKWALLCFAVLVGVKSWWAIFDQERSKKKRVKKRNVKNVKK